MTSRLYRFDTQLPEPSIKRDVTDDIRQRLLSNYVVALIGGHGMGKSSFLQTMKEELEQSQDVRVYLVREPAHPRTRQAFGERLAGTLQVPFGDRLKPMFEAWYEQHPGHALVLMFDELDRYADTPQDCQAGRDFFNELEETCQQLTTRPGILGAGGIGTYLLGNPALGSSFMRRAEQFFLTPFSWAELQEYADPLAKKLDLSADSERFSTLLEETRVLTGGHPQLTAFVFRGVLDVHEREGRIVEPGEVVNQYLEGFPDFCDDIHRGAGLHDPELGPSRLLSLIRRSPVPLDRRTINRELKGCKLHPDKALRVLLASGLVHLASKSRLVNPLPLKLIPSVMSFPESDEEMPTFGSLRERLRFDLKRILQFLNRCAPDYFHEGKAGRKPVEEATFSAAIGMGFHMSGWEDVFRELLQATGRVDLWLRYPDFEGHAIVEVKRWGNKDKTEIHRQVTRYANSETMARATVMIDPLVTGVSRETYEEECLKGKEFQPLEALPEWKHWEAGEVDHFLVHVPRSAEYGADRDSRCTGREPEAGGEPDTQT